MLFLVVSDSTAYDCFCLLDETRDGDFFGHPCLHALSLSSFLDIDLLHIGDQATLVTM